VAVASLRRCVYSTCCKWVGEGIAARALEEAADVWRDHFGGYVEKQLRERAAAIREGSGSGKGNLSEHLKEAFDGWKIRVEKAEAKVAELEFLTESLNYTVNLADAAKKNAEDALAKEHEVRRQLGAVLDQFVDEHDSPEVGHGPCRCDICEAGHIALAASAALDTAGAKEKQ
jgi:hypothetical protein